MRKTYYFFAFYAIVLVAVMTLCHSCTEENALYAPDKITTIVHLPPQDTIKGQKMNIDLLMAHSIECIDTLLVVLSQQPKAYINVINSKNDSLLAQFGDKGHAANEFIDPPGHVYINKIHNGDYCLFCPDFTKHTTKCINLDKSIKQNKCIIEKEIKQKEEVEGFLYFHLNENHNICRKTLTYDDPRDNIFYPPYFSITNGNNTKIIRTFPNTMKNEITTVVFTTYFDRLKLSPDKTKLLQVFHCIDIFNVVDIKEGLVSGYITEGSYSFEDVQKMKSIEDAKEKVKMFTLDFCVTDKYIILLRDERLGFESEEDISGTFKSKLSIFDWEGNAIAAYFLDRNIKYIAYNEKSKILYGIDLESKLYKYDMSNWIKQ